MSDRKGDGPDEQERLQPGDTSTHPTGKSSEEPTEGPDDTPPRQSGLPEG